MCWSTAARGTPAGGTTWGRCSAAGAGWSASGDRYAYFWGQTLGLGDGWFAQAARAVLVRPDKYVFGVAQDRDGFLHLCEALERGILGSSEGCVHFAGEPEPI